MFLFFFFPLTFFLFLFGCFALHFFPGGSQRVLLGQHVEETHRNRQLRTKDRAFPLPAAAHGKSNHSLFQVKSRPASHARAINPEPSQEQLGPFSPVRLAALEMRAGLAGPLQPCAVARQRALDYQQTCDALGGKSFSVRRDGACQKTG